MNMLKRGMSWNSIIEAASGSGKKLSRAALSKLARRVRETAQARPHQHGPPASTTC
jgi:hypothetical protein